MEPKEEHAGFRNEVKGKGRLAFSRELDVQYKTAFVRARKLRETMASSVKGLRIGGEGRVAEIDGAYFGGHVRPENRAANRVDRRRAGNKSGKRRVVVAIHERGGRTLAQVFTGEEAAVPAIRQRIARGTVVHADESPAWNRYAQEAAWREDLRRVSNGEQTHSIVGFAMRSSPSVDFCGYWQRTQAA